MTGYIDLYQHLLQREIYCCLDALVGHARPIGNMHAHQLILIDVAEDHYGVEGWLARPAVAESGTGVTVDAFCAIPGGETRPGLRRPWVQRATCSPFFR